MVLGDNSHVAGRGKTRGGSARTWHACRVSLWTFHLTPAPLPTVPSIPFHCPPHLPLPFRGTHHTHTGATIYTGTYARARRAPPPALRSTMGGMTNVLAPCRWRVHTYPLFWLERIPTCAGRHTGILRAHTAGLCHYSPDTAREPSHQRAFPLPVTPTLVSSCATCHCGYTILSRLRNFEQGAAPTWFGQQTC